MTPESKLGLIAVLSMSLMVASCSRNKEWEESESAYQAACQGPPLRTVERRNKAMEDGHDINRRFDCIDKASFLAAVEQRAKWEAANTPEALAERKAEREKMVAEEQARKTATVENQTAAAASPDVVLRNVDVNTATQSELASVISVGPEVAAQIMEERKRRPFTDWADLIDRVIGLHSARSAYIASANGLNVKGQSLSGAPPGAAMATALSKKSQQN